MLPRLRIRIENPEVLNVGVKIADQTTNSLCNSSCQRRESTIMAVNPDTVNAFWSECYSKAIKPGDQTR